jgi:hypothetical protein
MAILQQRIEKFYPGIQLPQVFEEEDRGFFRCCKPVLMLGDNGGDTWKNDVTSAWIKLSDPADTFEFVLEKDGVVVTAYSLTVNEFAEEENAFYTTISWGEVLAAAGIGCYTLKIAYNISGFVGAFTWGIYKVLPYSIKNALGTARVRVKLNLKQEIENINFTGSNVEDSLRFCGFIGDRQTNTEIDNLIYQTRTVKTVVRENLETYIITTDPSSDEIIRRFTQLYLLSENELFISDYNAHNHTYLINDVPVIVEESPELDYLDRFQRQAILTCQVGDRKKNKRTYY